MNTMTETKKPRAIIVGGKKFNVPRDLQKAFNIVEHYEQTRRRIEKVPAADVVIFFYEYGSSQILRAITDQLPNVPVVRTRASWSSLYKMLENMGLLYLLSVVEKSDVMSEEDIDALTDPEPEAAPEPERPAAPPPAPVVPTGAPLTSEEFAKVASDARRISEQRDSVSGEIGRMIEKREALEKEIQTRKMELEQLDRILTALRPVLEAEQLMKDALENARRMMREKPGG